MGKREYLNIINCLKTLGLTYYTDSFTGEIQLLDLPVYLEDLLLKTTIKNDYLIIKEIHRKAIFKGYFQMQRNFAGFTYGGENIIIREATIDEINNQEHYKIKTVIKTIE